MSTIVCKRDISTELHRESLKPRKPRKTPLLKKNNLMSRLEYAKDTTFLWCYMVWSYRNYILGINDGSHVWWVDGSALDMKNSIPKVKHGGGSIMIQGCFSSHEIETIEIIEGRMNGAMHREILDNNLQRFVDEMPLSGGWRFLHDNNPNHTTKET